MGHSWLEAIFKEENRIALSLSLLSLPSVSSFSLLSLSPFPFAPTHPPTMWHSEETGLLANRSTFIREPNQLATWTSQPPRTVRNECPLFNPPSPWCLLMAIWATTPRSRVNTFPGPADPNCDISWIYFPEKWTIWGTAVSLKEETL